MGAAAHKRNVAPHAHIKADQHLSHCNEVVEKEETLDL